MPTLKELAQLGKQALLAFVAQLLTELAALKARVEELPAENAALKAQLEQLRAGREATSRPLLQGPTQGPAQTPGTKAGPGALHLPHPADARPVDRPSDRGPTARAGLSLLR